MNATKAIVVATTLHDCEAILDPEFVDGTGDATGSLLKGTSALGESPKGAGGDAMGAEADGTGAAGANSGDGPGAYSGA